MLVDIYTNKQLLCIVVIYMEIKQLAHKSIMKLECSQHEHNYYVRKSDIREH